MTAKIPGRPGAELPQALRTAILERDGYTCRYCGFASTPARAAEELEVDHRRDIARGGRDHEANLAAACTGCNFQKARRTPREYSRWRRHNPQRANAGPLAW